MKQHLCIGALNAKKGIFTFCVPNLTLALAFALEIVLVVHFRSKRRTKVTKKKFSGRSETYPIVEGEFMQLTLKMIGEINNFL